jgi:CHAD domain-containing protein
MSQDIEIEAKFTIVDQDQLRLFIDGDLLLDHYPLTAIEQVVHVDTYFDTRSFQLLRNGQTLRIRQIGDGWFATAKSIGLVTPKGVHTRTEVERPFTPDAAPGDIAMLTRSQLPTDVSQALQAYLPANEKLWPICRLHQVRDKRLVSVRRNWKNTVSTKPLAELSIDRVTVFRPARAGRLENPSAGEPHTHNNEFRVEWQRVDEFDELEIELAATAPKRDLKILASQMPTLPGLAANVQNKLQQALTLISEQEPGQVEPDHPARLNGSVHMAELCRRAWRKQVTDMLLNEAGVRYSDNIEYIHDMRVATRRARAAARLYAQFFRASAVKPFIKQLRATGRLLGAVRDLDVAIARLETFCEDRAPEQCSGLNRLLELWRNRRNTAHVELLHWLDNPRYDKFIKQFAAFCQTPGAGAPTFTAQAGKAPAPHQVRHVIPSMLMSCYETVRAFEVLLDQPQPIPTETLHALRIECKYLRYHLEFTGDLLGAEGAELVERLKQLQDHLGNLNDASVTSAMISAAGADIDAPDVTEYRSLQKATLDDLRSRLPGDLVDFLGEDTRRKFALALARI